MKGLKHDVDHEIHHEVHYANHVFHSPKQDTVAHFSHTTGQSMTDIDNEWYDWVSPPKSRMEKSLEKYKKLPKRDEMNDEFGDFDSFKNYLNVTHYHIYLKMYHLPQQSLILQ